MNRQGKGNLGMFMLLIAVIMIFTIWLIWKGWIPIEKVDAVFSAVQSKMNNAPINATG